MRFMRPGRSATWTKDRIQALTTPDVRQLRVNATRLNEAEVMGWCDEVLSTRPRGGARGKRRKPNGRRLVSRGKAFEMRGVVLQHPVASRGGVRKSDGVVVMSLWAADVRAADGGCSYLLWAPNVDGSRPWSDKSGGKERLEHCRMALQHGRAEGLLVYGERLEGSLPDDKAFSVEGIDCELVLDLRIEQRGEEYWATWGKKQAEAA